MLSYFPLMTVHDATAHTYTICLYITLTYTYSLFPSPISAGRGDPAGRVRDRHPAAEEEEATLHLCWSSSSSGPCICIRPLHLSILMPCKVLRN